jgi:fibronectin-binding autotransporter adhesin
VAVPANWSSNASPGWNSTGVPNAIGATVTFNSAISLTATQDNASGVTVGTLDYNGAGNFGITVAAGTNGLTFNNDGTNPLSASISNNSTSTGTTNAFIFTGTLTLADNLTISNTGGSTNTTGAVQINGTLGGTGNLILNNVSTAITQASSVRFQTGVNTFIGTVLVRTGTISFNNSASFGGLASNTITLGESGQGSAALITTTGGLTVPNNIVVASGSTGTLTLGGVSTSTSTVTNYTGSVTLNGDVNLTSANPPTGSVTFSGAISGNGAITKVGAGVVTLSGSNANTYAGLTILNAGRIALAKTSGINAIGGNLVQNNATTITFTASTASDQIPNTASVTVNGGIFNGSGINTGTANVTETIGSLSMNSSTAQAAFNTGSVSVWTISGVFSATGGALGTIVVGNSGSRLTADGLNLNDMTATPGNTIPTDNSFAVYGNTATRQSQLTIGASGLTLNNSVLNLRRGSAAGSLGSLLILNGDVTTIGASPSSIIEDTAGGTLGTRDISLSSVAGDFIRTFNVGSGGANLTVSVPITNGTATNGGILKIGGGTLILSGVNTYTNTTTVTAGRLLVNGNSAAATGNVTVNSAGTLGGSGTVGGLTTVTGTIAPGNAGIGTLTIANQTNIDHSATFEWDIGTGAPTSAMPSTGGSDLVGNQDLLAITLLTNSYSANSTTTYRIVQNGALTLDPNQGYSFTLVTSPGIAGAPGGIIDTTLAADFAAYDAFADNFLSITTSGGNVYLNAIPVPEPSLLLGLGLMSCVALNRRRSVTAR